MTPVLNRLECFEKIRKRDARPPKNSCRHQFGANFELKPPDHPPRWEVGNFITNSAQAAERAIRDTSTYSYIHSKMPMIMMRRIMTLMTMILIVMIVWYNV